jgi:ribosomal protein L37AE/L43A
MNTILSEPKPKKKPPTCPECESGQVFYVRGDGIFWCRRCGFEWIKTPTKNKTK